MELKYRWQESYWDNRFGFNRTFMELKSLTYFKVQMLSCWFNRTFMELKLRFKIGCSFRVMGLIVPLWNWNRCCRAWSDEWNWFNRTFIELKYDRILSNKVSQQGLIVPLWNWNFIWDSTTPSEDRGLIVPLWNWNVRKSRRSN